MAGLYKSVESKQRTQGSTLAEASVEKSWLGLGQLEHQSSDSGGEVATWANRGLECTWHMLKFEV